MCDYGTSSCDLNISIGPPGLQGPVGPPPSLSTGSVTTLSPGQQATVQLNGGPDSYTIDFGIPEGQPGTGTAGTDGINAFSYTTASFIQPTDSGFGTVAVTMDEIGWAAYAECVYMEGGGTYRVVGKAPSTPGYTGPGTLTLNLLPVGSYTAPTTVIASGQLVTPSGEPGAAGATGATGATGSTGAAGTSAYVPLVTSVPVGAPSPGYETQFYTDSLSTPTIFRLYYYSGGVWTAGPNLISYLVFTYDQVSTASSDNMGTHALRTQRIVGFDTTTVSHTVSGTEAIRLEYQSTQYNCTADIDLDWDNTNFAYGGVWQVIVRNTSGASINITYAAGRWSKATGLSLPATLAAGETQIFVMRKPPLGRLTIENTYVVVNV